MILGIPAILLHVVTRISYEIQKSEKEVPLIKMGPVLIIGTLIALLAQSS